MQLSLNELKNLQSLRGILKQPGAVVLIYSRIVQHKAAHVHHRDIILIYVYLITGMYNVHVQ